MKKMIVIALFVAAVTFASAEDDGQYHPERYGADDGQYRHQHYGYYDPTLNNLYSNNYFNARTGRYNNAFSQNQAAYNGLYNRNNNLFHSFNGYKADPNAFRYYSLPSAYKSIATSVPSAAVTYKSPVAAASALAPLLTVLPPRAPARAVATAATARYAAGHYSDRSAQILRQQSDARADAYHYLYETENGINVEEAGRVAPEAGSSASGFYEFVADDGVKYRVDYTADRRGFLPVGAHLPTAPPVPADIARSLAARGLPL